MIHPASSVRGRKAKGRLPGGFLPGDLLPEGPVSEDLPAGPEPGKVGTVRTIDILSGAGIEGRPAQPVHLLGLDAAGLTVPDTTHAAVAEAREPRDPRERGLHVLAEPDRSGDQLDELARLCLSSHATLVTLGMVSRELG